MGSTHAQLVQVRFQPLWRYIDGIREFCGFFTRATFEDRAAGDRIGLVVHELVENAIRYSTRDEDAVLELRVHSDAQGIEVIVVNSAPPERIAVFAERCRALAAADPREAYLEAMAAARNRPDGESGLGLPRVCFEGRMTLALTVEPPNLVTLSAKGEP